MALTDAVRKLIEGTLGTVNLRNNLKQIFALYTEEAPQDGTTYGRNNGAWVAAGGGGGSSARGILVTLKTESATTLQVGTEVTLVVPYDLTLDVTDSWIITSDDTCSVVVDVRRATVAAPGTFSSIAASAKPTLTADNYNTGAMTGWSTSVLAGERVRVIVESASGTNEVNLMIPVSAA